MTPARAKRMAAELRRMAADMRGMADELDPPGDRPRTRRRRPRVPATAESARALDLALQRAGITPPDDVVS